MKFRFLQSISLFLFTFTTLFLLQATSNQAEAIGNTYTVCPAGCDETSLSDALGIVGLSEDEIVLTDDYVFVHANEMGPLSVPTDVTISCEDSADTFGDAAEAAIDIYLSDGDVIEDCTFENTNFDASFTSDVIIRNNTFTDAAFSQLTFTVSEDWEVSGNTDVHLVQVQNSNDGLIDNNTFQCRFSNSCIYLSTAGGGPFDFTDPADVPFNIDITNNTITNYKVDNVGDIIGFDAGIDIDFIGNTIDSAVILDDIFLTILTVESAQVYLAENFIIFPDKDPGDTNGTWGINIRRDEAEPSLVVENNTIIMSGSESSAGSNSCLGVFDDGTAAGIDVYIDFSYNLCHNPFDDATGNGIMLNYNPASVTIQLTDSFNGLSNLEFDISDSNSLVTDLNANTVTSNALMRIENVDASDDYYPSPISRYYDVDGATDIGAYYDERVTSYLIDDDCVVDYTTCFSNLSSVLPDAVTTNDIVTIAAGTYDAVTLDFPATDVTFTGAGPATIFNAGGSGSALRIENISDSTFSDFQVEDTSTTIDTIYKLSHVMFEFGGSDYDDSLAVFGVPDATIVIEDATCAGIPMDADNFDATALVDSATEDINIGLADLFGNKITALIRDDLASNATDFGTFVTTACASPITVDAFVKGAYTVNSGEYTYNESVVTAAGLTLLPGLTNPPTLEEGVNVEEIAGLYLEDSDDNTFSGITTDSNDIGIYLDADSNGNNFVDSTLSGNSIWDLYSLATANNSFEDTDFTLANLKIEGVGDLEIYYTIFVNLADGSSGPIEGASVEISNALGTLIETLTTDASGDTPQSTPLLATQIGAGDSLTANAGGFNPFEINTTANSLKKATAQTINAPEQQINIKLSPVGSGGGSGSLNQDIFKQDFYQSAGQNALTIFEYLFNYNIVEGFSDNNLRPGKKINRAELTKMAVLAKMLDPNPAVHNNCFPDVTDQWFAQYVCLAKELGWVKGYSDGLFKPEKNINEPEAIKIITKISGHTNDDTPSSEGNWYDTYYNFAQSKNIFIDSMQNLEVAITRDFSFRLIFRTIVSNFYNTDYSDSLKVEFLKELYFSGHTDVNSDAEIIEKSSPAGF